MPLVFVWLILMAGAMYMLLWRPQQRRMSMVRALQSQLAVGDDVLTTSGIHARVVRLGDDDADLEIAPGTVIHVMRASGWAPWSPGRIEVVRSTSPSAAVLRIRIPGCCIRRAAGAKAYDLADGEA